jgi:hypothetical protein
MNDPKTILPKRPFVLPTIAVVFALSMAILAGAKLDARRAMDTADFRASLRRVTSTEALSDQWTSAYHVGTSNLYSSAVDTQGTPYLLGGIRTVAFQNQPSVLSPKHIEGQFLLAAPGSFIELNMVGDRNGHYVLKFAERSVALYFAVMNQDRIEVSKLKLRQGISGLPISVDVDGQCSLSASSWHLILPGCTDVKAIASYSTNLLADEILSFDYVRGAVK